MKKGETDRVGCALTTHTQHIQGPWFVNIKADGTGRLVIHDPVGRLIAVVPHHGNAQLIAKAPEMLALLKEFMAMFDPALVKDSRPFANTRALLRAIEKEKP